MLREHRHQAEDECKLAIVAAGEIEAYRLLADRFRFGDLGVVSAMVRPPLVAQQLPGKDHVLGGDRRSIGKFCRRIEVERHVAALGIGFHPTRNQSVKCKRLVIAARHQAFDHVVANRGRSDALHDERVETVEGAEHPLHQAAAFGGIGVGVGQAGEARGPSRFTVHGNGVLRLAGLCHARRVPTGENGKAEQRRTDGAVAP